MFYVCAEHESDGGWLSSEMTNSDLQKKSVFSPKKLLFIYNSKGKILLPIAIIMLSM